MTAKYFCDFCGVEIPEDKTNIHIHVLQTCDGTDGKPCKPYITAYRYDVCDKCYFQTTNVKAGFRGSNPEFISTTAKENTDG